MRACPSCGEETSERARFCPACGIALAPGTLAPQGLRKVVTVVFCDLVGSTSLGESIDPESLRLVLARYFQGMSDALVRHGGTVEKFIGDAVMAVFGIPTVREDDALRAVRAASDMRTELAELNEQLEARWGVRLQARTGVNTGEVIAGDSSRGQPFATGDAVNVAARLEQAAGVGEIFIGEHTLALVRDQVEVEPVAPLDLKGKNEPVPAFRLMSVGGRAAASEKRMDSPLVGRDRELALLSEAFGRAVTDRTCELVTVLGAAGIGKTRLAGDFTDSVRDEATVVAGRCLSYGEGLTFWPLREALEQLAGIDDGQSPAEAEERIADLLPAGDDRDSIVERVAGALGVSDSTAYPAETFWAVRRLIESAAARRPLVILFEDVHWAETTFLDLVEHLAGALTDVPVLIVTAARPELLDIRPGFGHEAVAGTRLELAPLSRSDSATLVEHLIGGAEVDPEVTRRVAADAVGNPLFVGELVRMLLADPSALSVPRTIQAVLAARLDRLTPAEHATVEFASVIGLSFPGGAVLELSGGWDRAELDQQLEALVGRQLIRRDGGRFAGEETFSFEHILVRDVAYQAILKEHRAGLHERHSDWLERTAGERAGEYEEIIGYHLERAYRYLAELGPVDERGQGLARRAAARLGSSGRRAMARGDIPPAVALLERAVSLLDEDDPARGDLSLKLGVALAETGQLTRVGALLQDRLTGELRGRAFVVVHDPDGRQHVVTPAADQGTVTIGRRADNDVALGWDNDVSRRHAHLLREDEGWAVVDDDSRNGSFLNGQRVEKRHPLRDGDVLRFGDTVVLFRAPVAVRGTAVIAAPEQSTNMGALPPEPPR